MKLKTLFGILFLSLFMLGLYSCDDDELQRKNLPENARIFLDNYFYNNTIVSIEKEFYGTESTGYKVLLNNEITVLFKRNGELDYVLAENGLPESAWRMIDSEVQIALKEKEPNVLITQISPLSSGGWLISLDNGKQYADYYGFEGKRLGAIISLNEIPTAMKEFLSWNNLSDALEQTYIIQLTESRGDIYRIPFGTTFIFSFDNAGKWIHAEQLDITATNTFLQKIVVQEIPAAVISTINTSENNLGSLYEISCFENDIYGFRFSEKTLLIDKLSGIIAPPTEFVKSLFENYFEPNGEFNENISISNPYRASFGYRYFYRNCSFFIYLGLENQWVSVIGFDNSVSAFTAIPSDFVNQEFPTKIVEYLNSNYIQPDVCIAEHHSAGYFIYIQNANDKLYFDDECNFLKREPFW